MKRKFSLWASSLAFACSLAAPAYAVDDLDLFELEGNAVQDGALPGAEDWETLKNGGGSANVFTGIKADPFPLSIFEGGKKDIDEISNWSHKDGSGAPDKDEITNAYAAAYDSSGDLIIYFGADRIANSGDAFLGFWFFKDEVVASPGGSFEGEHVAGDTLVLVDFPQASNASPQISVITWDPSCNRAASNNPSPGECAAKNLRLRLEGSGAAGAVCGSVSAGDDACAITNEGDETAPWPYVPKDGVAGTFPFESFYEGGINLSDILPGADLCFSSFLAETRASSSFTATLKDFVLDSFPLCSITIEKQCTDGTLNGSETGFVFTYDGSVTNDGFGTLFDVTVVDPTAGQSFSLGTLVQGQTKAFGGTFASTLNPPTNTASVSAAAKAGGVKSVTDGPASAECPRVNRDPLIDVTKECSQRFTETGGKVVVVVDFEGQVCNPTSGADSIGLVNVSVTDDSGTPGVPGDDQVFALGSLPADTCKPYSGSYVPAALPPAGLFTDTVTAIGTANLGFGQRSDTATATCPLCP